MHPPPLISQDQIDPESISVVYSEPESGEGGSAVCDAVAIHGRR